MERYIKAVDNSVRIYYNRPPLQNLTIYATYDEGWQYQNNIDDINLLPVDAVLQQIDYSFGNCRNLKYFNAFGHKKRFTGLNGGYYEESDSTYYTSGGSVSSFAVEFSNPVGASGNDGYVIDHLTGLGWRTIRGGSGGTNFSNQWITGINLWGWIDWYIPTINQYYSLNDYQIQVQDNLLSNGILQFPPFNYDQDSLNSCTTIRSRTDYYNRYGHLYQLSTITLKTSTGNGNRVFMRYHYPLNAFVIQP